MRKIKVDGNSSVKKINVRRVQQFEKRGHRAIVGHSLFINVKSLDRFMKEMGRA